MDVLILIGLIMLNGLFAMSEISLVTARKARLSKQAGEGDRGAAAALALGEDPTRFMSTIQIGITSIGILNGIYGESVLADPLAQWLAGFGIPPDVASIVSTVSVVIMVTYASIVIGELVPKRIGQMNPEPIARLVARPMQGLSLISRPFVWLLTVSTNGLIRLLGVKQSSQSSVTEEEIHAMLEEGSEAGVIDQHQHEMVRNVFRLDERQLGSLMIPRADVVFIDINRPMDENLHLLVSSDHSRFPVCDGGMDKILGVIHAKHVLATITKGEQLDLKTNLQPCHFVPETLTGAELLGQFRSNNIQMALVVDEYGEIEGMVTLQDVLEALTGEFTPRSADDAWAIQREDGSWLLDGSIPIPEMKDVLKIATLPVQDKGYYHTLSGMIMLLLGSIPSTGNYVKWGDWRFEVVDMDGKRIDKVLASQESKAAG